MKLTHQQQDNILFWLWVVVMIIIIYKIKMNLYAIH